MTAVTEVAEVMPLETSFLQEVYSVPIVRSVTDKVTNTHKTLCTYVPLYGSITDATQATTLTLSKKMSRCQIVKRPVNKMEELCLEAVTTLKTSCPILEKPTDEVIETVCTGLKKRALSGATHISTYEISRATCKMTECIFGKAEKAAATVNDSGVWKLVPDYVKLKFSAVSIKDIEHCFKVWRQSVRSWRRLDVHNDAGHCFSRTAQIELGVFTMICAPAKLLSWLVEFCYVSCTKLWMCAQALKDSTNKAVTSKEQRQPDGSESTEMSLQALLNDLDDYVSEEDPDYEPSNTSSSETYHSTDEGSGDLTNEDFEPENSANETETFGNETIVAPLPEIIVSLYVDE
nr:uncharacterized protein LOC128693871 [Cherax quadricarinatus]